VRHLLQRTVSPCAERTPARRAESAEDDLNEMHTNYEILTNQLLVEQARGMSRLSLSHANQHKRLS
jgi:hypothetical protein